MAEVQVLGVWEGKGAKELYRQPFEGHSAVVEEGKLLQGQCRIWSSYWPPLHCQRLLEEVEEEAREGEP